MWFRFEFPDHVRQAAERNGGRIVLVGGPHFPFAIGCGVSGYDEDDCLTLVREQVFGGRPLPELCDRVANIDVSTLPKHLQSFLGKPSCTGIWYPPLNLGAAR